MGRPTGRPLIIRHPLKGVRRPMHVVAVRDGVLASTPPGVSAAGARMTGTTWTARGLAHRALIAVVVAAAAARGAGADYDTFPAKSVPPASGPASSVVSYESIASELEDMHPVHAAALASGGVAVVGKALGPKGFLLLLDANLRARWTWQQTSAAALGRRALNAVVQLPSGLLLAVGYEKGADGAGGSLRAVRRAVYLIDPAAASAASCVLWSSTDFGDATGSNGAWEVRGRPPRPTRASGAPRRGPGRPTDAAPRGARPRRWWT